MKTSYPFKFSKLLFTSFIVLIILFSVNIIFNAVQIAQGTEKSKIIFILSIVFSSILLTFCLAVFLGARYKVAEDKITLIFGFFPILKINFDKISRIGKHSVTKETFIVFLSKKNFATHMLCTEEAIGDEIISYILGKNDAIEYIFTK